MAGEEASVGHDDTARADVVGNDANQKQNEQLSDLTSLAAIASGLDRAPTSARKSYDVAMSEDAALQDVREPVATLAKMEEAEQPHRQSGDLTSEADTKMGSAASEYTKSFDSALEATTSLVSSSVDEALDLFANSTDIALASTNPAEELHSMATSNERGVQQGGEGNLEEEEYGDDDGGVIRCICECDDDDGFTIQCDQCLVWQHCACFGMSQASVPEIYRCEACDPRPVDVAFAKAHQQRRRDAEKRKNLYARNVRRQSQNNASVDSEAPVDETNDVGGSDSNKRLLQDSKAAQGSGSISRSRKPSHQLDLSNIKYPTEESPTSTTPGSAKSGRKRGAGMKTGSRARDSVITPRASSSMRDGALHSITPTTAAGDRIDADIDALSRGEAWQVEYTPVQTNVLASEQISSMLSSISRDYLEQGSPLKAYHGSGTRMITHVEGKKVKILSGSVSNDGTHVDEEDISTALSAPSVALSAVGNECFPVEVNVSSLFTCTQKTYVRQISELASASIFNSLAQINVLPTEPQRSTSASRMFSKPIMHGLFADISIPAGCFIMEYRGEIVSADDYRSDPINQYGMIGATKPSVHLFPPPLNLCIDARRYGNTARFARYSCHPNAVLRPILLNPANAANSLDGPDATQKGQNDLEEGMRTNGHVEIVFGIFALGDIAKGHEITLGWEWDDRHIVHMLPQLARNPMLGVIDLRGAPGLSSTDPRKWDRELRNAAISTLVEKGDFPYADTEFSAKMNSVMTVLLSSCLCACIGSAAASSGGNSASSNNVKRQDCAIVQMLRLSQGMGMLNVNLPPHKSNRKSKAPDFEPLVGRKRWWRPDALPPTPPGLSQESEEDAVLRNINIPFKLAPGGKVGRVQSADVERALLARRAGVDIYVDVGEPGNARGDDDDDEDDDDDDDDAASSATEPIEEMSEDEESSVKASLRFDTEGVMIAREGDSHYLIHTALPPKKRISGTRLKAVSPGVQDSDVEYRGRKRGDHKIQQEKQSKVRRPVKRKLGARSYDDEDADDGDDIVDVNHARIARKSSQAPISKAKKKTKLADPSSPLSSAPQTDEEEEEEGEGATTVLVGESMGRRRRDDAKQSKISKSRRTKEVKAADSRKRDLLGDFLDDSDSSDGHLHDSRDDATPSKSAASRSVGNKRRNKVADSDEERDILAETSTTTATDGADRESLPLSAVRVQYSASEQPEIVSQGGSASTAPFAEVPPALPPVEIPKAKLSLAEYKKRLAERRTSGQPGATTPLATPTLPTQPTSPEKPSLPGTPLDTPTPGSASASYGGFNFPAPVTNYPKSIAQGSALSSEVSKAIPTISTSSVKSEFVTPTAAPRSSLPPPPPPPPPPSSSLPPPLPPYSTNTESSMSDIASRMQKSPVYSSFGKTKSSHPQYGGAAISTTVASAASAGSTSSEAATESARQATSFVTASPSSAMLSSPTKRTADGISADNTPVDPKTLAVEKAPQVSTSVQIRERVFDSTIEPPVSLDEKIAVSARSSSGTDAFATAKRRLSSSERSEASTASTFNPPKGPKALISATGAAVAQSVSTQAPPSQSAARSVHPATSGPPPQAPLLSPSSVQTQHPQAQTPRSRGPSLSGENLPDQRKPSPAHPGSSMPGGSSVVAGNTDRANSAGGATSSSTPAPASTSLNDFANVPKGPARMREREMMMRDREREWERDRDREWERDAPLAGMGPPSSTMYGSGRDYHRDPRDVRDARDVRDIRDVRDVRDARDMRDFRSVNELRTQMSRNEWEREGGHSYEHDYRMDDRLSGGGREYGAPYDRPRRLDDDRYDRPSLHSPAMQGGGRPSAGPPSPSMYSTRYDRPPMDGRMHERGGPGMGAYAPQHPTAPPPPPPPPPSSRLGPLRGGYGRGAPLGAPSAWSGRARTRGRGSRGGGWR